MIESVLEPKTPSEVKLYGVDWADRLGTATILTTTWEVPAGLTNDQESVSGQITLILLSAGVVNTNYTVVNTITTSEGETLQRAIQIRVLSAAMIAGITS